jgi:hypothetical protein
METIFLSFLLESFLSQKHKSSENFRIILANVQWKFKKEKTIVNFLVLIYRSTTWIAHKI